MPSNPLLGIPVVVGISEAVMAMRSTSSPRAGSVKTRQPASAVAKRKEVMVSSLRGPEIASEVGIPINTRQKTCRLNRGRTATGPGYGDYKLAKSQRPDRRLVDLDVRLRPICRLPD